jgi:hypothetical protein
MYWLASLRRRQSIIQALSIVAAYWHELVGKYLQTTPLTALLLMFILRSRQRL